jgi:hypothetical protein
LHDAGRAAIPRRNSGGRRWALVTEAAGVTATTASGPVAAAQVSERGDEVGIEFWADSVDAPSELRVQLVEGAFTHPAVRPNRSVIVSVPRGDTTVIAEARRHVRGSQAWVAGATCLIRGHVAGGAPSTS